MVFIDSALGADEFHSRVSSFWKTLAKNFIKTNKNNDLIDFSLVFIGWATVSDDFYDCVLYSVPVGAACGAGLHCV